MIGRQGDVARPGSLTTPMRPKNGTAFAISWLNEPLVGRQLIARRILPSRLLLAKVDEGSANMDRNRGLSPKTFDAWRRPPQTNGTGQGSRVATPKGPVASQQEGLSLLPDEPICLCPRCGSAAR